MASAFPQQVFAIDARYNALRAVGNPNFRTLYIRRRSQLLRETVRSNEQWRQYLKLRSMLLQQHYGSHQKLESGSMSNLSQNVNILSDLPNPALLIGKDAVVPTRQAEASRAIVGDNSIAENYAFSGVHHIFDQHSSAVTMVKFANNDKSLVCCSSLDGNLSVCDVSCNPPSVLAILKGHSMAVPAFEWSANNDFIASVSLDATIKLWKANDFTCLRTLKEPNNCQILCCIFRPSNNNLILIGNNKGELRVVNVSTGLFLKYYCRIGGCILSLTSDTNGNIVWAGNDHGEIVAVLCEINGALYKAKKTTIDPNSYITSLSYRTWISREARDPTLLVNLTNNSLCLFSVIDEEGGLQMKRKFGNPHIKHGLKSTFCPIMSFRQGACVVTGSEDGCVYFINVEKTTSKAVVNTLQGHCTTVLSVSFNCDESLLATSDLEGLVIIWKRAGKNKS
ncbi:WD repeat-containing protein 13-like isoform X2 [Euwallacea fornicatus]|uniref:WD repeat-containing protein 13-like isoform X2 n=2 Tax=Euwallacea fornicatus TaxID=995702 RepID=UPI00338D72AD